MHACRISENWTPCAVGAAILGMVFFKEPATAARILCIVAIVGGILGLELLHTTSPSAT
jgi:multidrug transporter EmrE-like cation transporter